MTHVPDTATWRRSSQCGSGPSCVEVAVLPGGDAYAMRDSADPATPALVFSADAWRVFVKAIKDGEFDPPQ